MEDIAYQALLAGDSVVAWIGAVVLAFVVKLVTGKIHNDKVRVYVGRALHEVGAAVADVYQTYVGALKEANADGKLTDAEKAEAMARARRKAKSNIGAAGLERLGRILGGGVDNWIENKIEAEIDARRGPVDPT